MHNLNHFDVHRSYNGSNKDQERRLFGFDAVWCIAWNVGIRDSRVQLRHSSRDPFSMDIRIVVTSVARIHTTKKLAVRLWKNACAISEVYGCMLAHEQGFGAV